VIFKIQRSQAPVRDLVLIYNEDREIMLHMSVDSPLKALFEQHGDRIFCDCKIVDGVLDIGPVVEDPGW
jgi:hypothetical protein